MDQSETIRLLQAKLDDARARIADLERDLGDRDALPFGALGLSPVRLQLLAILFSARQGWLSRPMLFERLYARRRGAAESDAVISAHIAHIRKILAPYGVEIDSAWGNGYRLTNENRERLLAAVETWKAGSE